MRCNITWDSSSSGSPQSRTSRSVIWFLAIRWHLGDRTASLPLARFAAPAEEFRRHVREHLDPFGRSAHPLRVVRVGAPGHPCGGEVRVVFAHAHDSKAS
eukprot:tig00020927_g16012.t1